MLSQVRILLFDRHILRKSFFSVEPSDLALDPKEGTDVVRQLIWSEAISRGVPRTATDIPFCIDHRDGGVDATVDTDDGFRPSAFIPSPRTYYQVKTGDFDPTPSRKNEIEELLIRKSKISERKKAKRKLEDGPYTSDDLLPKVKECLDAGGTFTIVLFGADGSRSSVEASEEAIRKFLLQIGGASYREAKIKVWKQSQICTLLESYPIIALMIRKQFGFSLTWFERWDQSERSLPPLPYQQLELEETQEKLREILRGPSSRTNHIRIYGAPGVGKSRWLLDTLRAEDLSPHVVFARGPIDLKSEALSMLKGTNVQRLILVVDRCPMEECSTFYQDLAGFPFTLITIAPLIEDRSNLQGTTSFMIEALGEPESLKLLTKIGVARQEIRQWARLCDGNFLAFEAVAYAIAQDHADPFPHFLNYQGLVQLLDGNDAFVLSELDRRVLATLSLLDDPELPQSDKSNRILFDQFDGKVGRDDVRATVLKMKVRGVLTSGDRFSFFPMAVKVRLWLDWWERYSHEDNTQFFNNLLNDSSFRVGAMFEFASLSPKAQNFARQFLKSKEEKLLGGEMEERGTWLRSANAAELFNGLAHACPALAMKNLDILFENGTAHFNEGRPAIVAALKHMALYSNLFAPAATKLLILAAEESVPQLMGASEAFTDLFSPGVYLTGPSDGKHAGLLAKFVRDEDNLRAEISLAAFATALTPTKFVDQPKVSLVNKSAFRAQTEQSATAEAGLYLEFWTELTGLLSNLTGPRRDQAIAILLMKFPALVTLSHLREPIAQTLEHIAGFDDVPKKQLADAIERLSFSGAIGLPATFRSRVVALTSQHLSLEARLKACCGVRRAPQFDSVDGHRVPFSDDRLLRLAQELFETTGALAALLEWLLSSENHRGFEIGFWLASNDKQFEHWLPILEGWAELYGTSGNEFLAGYLHNIQVRGSDRWEEGATCLFAYPQRNLPTLLREGSITEAVAARLIDVIADSRANPADFESLTKPENLRKLSDQTLERWLAALLDCSKRGAGKAAFSFAATCAFLERRLSFDSFLAAALLPFEGFAQLVDGNASFASQWTTLSAWLIEGSMPHRPQLFDGFLENLGKPGLGDIVGSTLLDICINAEMDLWRQLSKMLLKSPPDYWLPIFDWARGRRLLVGREPGALSRIPTDVVLEWVSQAPETRAVLAALAAPYDFAENVWKEGLSRSLVMKYGHWTRVREALLTNLYGNRNYVEFPGVERLFGIEDAAGNINYLRSLAKKESDDVCSRWLTEAAEELALRV